MNEGKAFKKFLKGFIEWFLYCSSTFFAKKYRGILNEYLSYHSFNILSSLSNKKNNDIFNYIILHEILLHFKLLCPNEWRQLPFISGLHLNIELN